jgi:hypothetical protein
MLDKRRDFGPGMDYSQRQEGLVRAEMWEWRKGVRERYRH